MSITKICNIKPCEYKGVNYRRSLCPRHYLLWLQDNATVKSSERLKPRPAIVKGDIAKIPLGVNAKDGYAIVDKEYAYLADTYKWSKDNYGYALTGSSPKRYKLHHMVKGTPPKGMVTDHINRDTLDNRLENLRHTSYSVNSINKPLSKKNKSGHKNIYWNKKAKKWAVQVKREHLLKCLGEYKDISEAIKARDNYLHEMI